MAPESTHGTIDTAAIVETWVATAARESRMQRWREARFPFIRPAAVSRGGMETPAVCRDISKDGIGILQSDYPPKVGEAIVTVWLRNEVIDLGVDIKWTKRLGSGWWAAGGQLLLSSRDYARLLLSRIGTEIERRFHKRYPFFHPFSINASSHYDASCSVDSDSQEEAILGLSLDLSCGGIRILSETYFEPQEQFVRLSRIDSKDGSDRICGQVVSCQEMPNGYYATGVQFAPSTIKMKSIFDDG